MKAWKVALVNDESADQVIATGTKRKAVRDKLFVRSSTLSDDLYFFRTPAWTKLNYEVSMIMGC
jgi:hypothetical protein